METAIPPVAFRDALRFWLKLGFISFGGPAGQIAILHEYVVERRQWLTEERFLHALNYCMLLPGPEAQQLATYIGWLLHGVRGGLVAGILFVLPSAVLLLGLSWVYVTWGTLPAVVGILYGLKPAVVAIVLGALLKIGQKSLRTPLRISVAALSFLALAVVRLPFPVVVLGAIFIGVIVQRWRPAWLRSTPPAGFAPQAATIVEAPFRPGRRVLRLLLVAVALWVLPLLIATWLTGDWPFWRQLTGFFTAAAFFTFGGAYAVLPYVAQVAVEQLGWLTRLEMIDGLALGETTPGPLIMVLAFVGFMGAWRHGGHSIVWGAAGLALTTFYTFLPSFLFIFIGAPLIERTRQDERIKATLSVVTAAVVGVILNLALYLGSVVVWPQGLTQAPDWFSLSWIFVSVLALRWLQLNMVVWIVVSAIMGWAYSSLN
ncbi:chromate transporter, chromate ion transporter (CHR) family [Hymenobacter roseosalivarius DSM 11622]|uniref:Chromate transporter, chromate ion transporter (CHR) family n=1 Tax=Hymenobacter roseosalivarius DSM 11622 TaxID=645990 RepID=A0A1W1W4A4_9BACT|nr:chromate efflux transporter [Hymenobacter roseosalivarius]SMC00426.1 chromate transporter, chromate ion transporter (CHR) family [Hymenobacter roseosalivarius DSM 11622]